MIVVLGRPALPATVSRPDAPEADRDREGDPSPAQAHPSAWWPAGPVAMAASAAGGRVELVGTIGDDPTGDLVVVGLGSAGVGHAALLRDPAGRTPVQGSPAGPAATIADPTESASRPLPRLDARDIELGLGYLVGYGVIVLTEPLAEDAESTALEAAAYNGAQVVALVPEGRPISDRLAAAATVLEAPAAPGARFADLVGRYAAGLDAGMDPARAFQDAVRATGWESSAD